MELIVETKDFFAHTFSSLALQLAGLDDLACRHPFYAEAIAFRWSRIVIHIAQWRCDLFRHVEEWLRSPPDSASSEG
jgi:hypothetical protein